MRKPWVLWLLALLITAASAVYQRMTGPSHPKRGKTSIAGQEIRYRLIRSWDGAGGAEVRLPVPAPQVRGTLLWKRFKTKDEWASVPMSHHNGELAGTLPHQPPAGKLQYRVLLEAGGPLERERVWLGADGVVIRYRGAVPLPILITHVIAMFAAMLCAVRAGLEVVAEKPAFAGIVAATLICFTLGGMILGPIVQKYAFGAYWTGWPFGADLTDNKTAFAWLAWIAAYIAQRRSAQAARWILFASACTLLVYLIPHSLFGSELKYE